MMTRPKIIVVGAGLAGLMASLRTAQANVDVDLFSLQPACRSRSTSFSDGIAAALNTKGEDDSVEVHAQDTLAAANGLVDTEVITRMCEAAPRLVHLFDRLGVPFNRTCEGKIDLCSMPGSTKRRVAFVETMTGHALVTALDDQVRRSETEKNIQRYEGWMFLSLLKGRDGTCVGIVAQHLWSLARKVFPADAVVLCTGGFGNIYECHANMPLGYAAAQAYMQGAVFANPEFVQFEETKVVCTLGGLWIDVNHQTSIPGLFAAGGCAAQYHGASVLLQNVPLAVVHGGEVAGRSAVEWAGGKEVRADTLPTSLFKEEERVREYEQDKFLAMSGYENPHKLKRELGELLQTHAGGVRHRQSLEAAREKVATLRDRFWQSGILDHARWANQELVFMRQFSRELELAQILVAAALKREESRGVHQRSDYPAVNETTWRCATKVIYDEEKPVIGT